MQEKKTYDLTLGKWGPYNKQYLGASHIADEKEGITFCVELFPGFFRRSLMVSHQSNDGGLKMHGANPALTHFSYRYRLEGKDDVYVDAHFNVTEDQLLHIDCVAVNNTDMRQSVIVNMVAGLMFPDVTSGAEPDHFKVKYKPVLKNDALYIDAVDYDDICCDTHIPSDGKYLCETEREKSTNYITCLGGEYFYKEEHRATYCLKKKANSVGIRYCTKSGQAETGTIKIYINGAEHLLHLENAAEYVYQTISFDECEVKKIEISPNGQHLFIDSIVVGMNAEQSRFEEQKRCFEPTRREIVGNEMHLSYQNTAYQYIVSWEQEPLMIRRIFVDDPGRTLAFRTHDHVSEHIISAKRGERISEDIFTNPLYLEPHTKGHFRFSVQAIKCGEEREKIKPKYRREFSFRCNADGEKYLYGENLMAYTTMLNVVYPIYTRRGYIRHNTPGRNWNCLYSWDSGFIGMGLACTDFERAFDCLNTYLTPVGDKHSPYIFHGSVVPTQIYLYAELVNKFPNKRARLKTLYPMVKQYYDFYSTMEREPHQTKSGLIKTWHLFYSTGGWDDYPPQWQLRLNEEKGETEEAGWDNVTPVITTSGAVLIAKILKCISHELGIFEHDAQFEQDIEKYSDAIQKYTWDEEVGYYSYLVHNADGTPKEFYRYTDGTNFNLGFDGIYPYIAGISNSHQSEKIKENIENGLMTKYGICVVDKRAPYYTPYGYWNGSVWMPHQWILWKSLLDKGEIKLAMKIAKTALEVWKKETEASGCTFENFMSANGRGAGYHQFSGLSTPVLMFYEALYVPGTVSTGFFAGVTTKKWNRDKSKLNLEMTASSERATVVVCMNSNFSYCFYVDGKNVEPQKLSDGAYCISLNTAGKHNIAVSKCEE